MTDLVEKIAKEIYKAMGWAYEDGSGNKAPAWVENGNSHAQTEARQKAHAALSVIKEDMSSLVKQLEWEVDKDGSCFTSCGSYTIYQSEDGQYLLSNGDIDVGHFNSIETAKAAAWQDHKPYVLSLLNLGGE